MQKEMSMLRQLAEEGKITQHDAMEMILAMHEAERTSVWEEEGEFDPRRFMAKMEESSSQTMLNDIIWLKRSKCTEELTHDLRNLTGAKREELLERISVLSPADPAQFAENPLMVNIDYLRHQRGLDALSTLAAFKHLEDFSGCLALERFGLDRSRKILLNSAQQKRAAEEFRTSLPMRNGDTIRVHDPTSVEIHQTEGQDLEVIAEKVCWADTEDEARKLVRDMEIWTFPEGNRVWIRDSRFHDILGFCYMVHLRLFVPRGIKVAGSILSNIRAKDVEVNLGVTTLSGSFYAENLAGDTWVNARTGNVNIIGLDGKAEIEALSGDISVENSRADLTIRSVLGDVTCDRLSGACKAKLIQGSLTMADTCTSSLDLSTKGGKITFDGVVMGAMDYEIRSESGDIEVSLDERSDCGLLAESEKGKINCTSFEDGVHRIGPNSIRLYFRRGTGGMDVMSKSGNIVIKSKERSDGDIK